MRRVHAVHEPVELAFTAARDYEKPFVHVRQFAELAAPSGRRFFVDGFHDGGRTWRVRFAPHEAGRWAWRTWSEPHDAGLAGEGALEATVTQASRGFLRATPGEGWGFRWSDGAPAFLVGDTMYNLPGYAHSGHDPLPFLERRLAQGMDLQRIRAHCSSLHRRPPRHSPWMSADVWPWGGIPQDPDFETFNLRYFHTLDRLVQACQRLGVALELICECWLFELPFRDRQRFTAEDEELWIRWLVARYAAYRAIAIWTPGNEYVYYPDGETPLTAWDQRDTRPDRWIARLARLIRSRDPQARPIAAHTMTLPQPTFAQRLAAFPEVDTILFQDWGRRDEHAWTADGLDEAIVQQLAGARQSCVLAEYGYESIDGLPVIETRRHMGREHTRRGAWRGAFHAMLVFAGFENTWGPYMQLDPDAPGAADLVHLRRFFVELAPFASLRPAHHLVQGGRDDVPGAAPRALATPDGATIAAYLPAGGRLAVAWPSTAHTRRLAWFDPRTGALHPAPPTPVLVPPGGPDPVDDWVLLATPA